MQVKAIIATPLELKKTGQGKPFYAFRLAENHGKGDKKKTCWYDVAAFVDEMTADLLGKGMLVEVQGRLEVNPWLRGDGSAAADLRLIAFSVEPTVNEPRAADAGE